MNTNHKIVTESGIVMEAIGQPEAFRILNQDKIGRDFLRKAMELADRGETATILHENYKITIRPSGSYSVPEVA